MIDNTVIRRLKIYIIYIDVKDKKVVLAFGKSLRNPPGNKQQFYR